MNFEEIKTTIKQIPLLENHFFGIFESANRANSFKPNKNKGFSIFFTPSKKDDEDDLGHFTCLFYQRNHVYFFDSFGFNPLRYGLENIDDYNKVRVQPYDSCSCGLYVLFFAFQSINMGASSVVDKFFINNTEKENQNLVYKWIRQFKPISNSLKTCEQ